ncbi:MAG: methyltransferase domain-containing protein [Bradymonadales bacterium]|nr:methyltransferase domain-containing protein [Bradymonadales bacterium]
MAVHPSELLICPLCRQPPQAWPVDPDSLTCSNPDCRRVFPRLSNGVPVIVPGSVDSILQVDVNRDLPSMARWLVELNSLTPGEPTWDSAVFAAMYLSAHYGGEAEPFTALCDLLLPRIPEPTQTAVDLGCGPGRLTLEIAHRTGCAVTGLDHEPTNLYWANLAQRSQQLVWPRLRSEGLFELTQADVPVSPTPGRVRWICADVLHPPLAASAFDLVLAVNLLDSVRDPWVVLGQAVALIRPGGYLILAQPDSWSRSLVEPEHWLATEDGQWDALLHRLGLRTLERVDSIPWEMARTHRVRYRYRLHGRLAVKEG